MVSMGPKTNLLACLLLAAFALSGCSGGGSPEDEPGQDLAEDAPEIEVTETTGGIRGVVVDDAIRPIKGATVEVMGTGKTMTTDETGLFAFSGLLAGPYFVKAGHPLYDVQQQNVEVVAGVADPAPVKFLLTRVILQNPYYTTLKFDGFIVCSTNVGAPGAGYLLSEECGEGVGVECVDPNVPCGRVGGQGNNFVQFDFVVESDQAKSLIVEQVWEPTSEAGKGLYSPVSLNWFCDPVCGGDTFLTIDGESPTYGYAGNATLADLELTTNTTISVFTWASPAGTTGASLTLNQPYQEFVTISYFLPLPEGWSFVKGDPDPFA